MCCFGCFSSLRVLVFCSFFPFVFLSSSSSVACPGGVSRRQRNNPANRASGLRCVAYLEIEKQRKKRLPLFLLFPFYPTVFGFFSLSEARARTACLPFLFWFLPNDRGRERKVLWFCPFSCLSLFFFSSFAIDLVWGGMSLHRSSLSFFPSRCFFFLSFFRRILPLFFSSRAGLDKLQISKRERGLRCLAPYLCTCTYSRCPRKLLCSLPFLSLSVGWHLHLRLQREQERDKTRECGMSWLFC